MLVLGLKLKSGITIINQETGEIIEIVFAKAKGNNKYIHLGIQADKKYKILRNELINNGG